MLVEGHKSEKTSFVIIAMHGHIENKCWKKHDKPNWANQSNSPNATPANLPAPITSMPVAASPSASNIATLSNEDFKNILRLAQGDTNTPFAPVAQVGISTSTKASPSSWLIDFGASDHMTGSPHLFSHFKMFFSLRKVILIDGNSFPTLGQGHVDFSPHLYLDDV